MQCYNELIAPTAITHSISAPFISSNANDLIVVRLSQLQIFEVARNEQSKRATSARTTNDADSSSQTQESQKLRLVFHSQYDLSGIVTDISSVQLSANRHGRRALLVAFRDAKMSLICWDPELDSISTVSIHYYEGDGIVQNPIVPSISESGSFLTVDPHDRCAALKFGSHHVAFLPFKQAADEMETEFDPVFDDSLPGRSGYETEQFDFAQSDDSEPYLPSFILPLSALDMALNIPIHFAFLYGYREPTFGILHAKRHPSTALLPERRDPLCYSVHSLHLEKRTSTSLLTVTGLPYDLCEVIPLRLPIGGVLLVGANELVHVDQSGKVTGTGVNPFAEESSLLKLRDQSNLGLRLEGCIVQPMGTNTSELMIVLNDGRMALIMFDVDGRSVTQLRVELVDQSHLTGSHSSPASCSSLLLPGYLFLGSIDGDSHLIGWKRTGTSTATNSQKKLLEGLEGLDEEAGDKLDIEDIDDIDDDDDDLYTTKHKQTEHQASKAEAPLSADSLRLTTHDILPSLAPINDFSIRPRKGEYNSESIDTISKVDLYAAIGAKSDSSVAILSRSITVKEEQSVKVASSRNLWISPALSSSSSTNPEGNATLDEFLFVSKATLDEGEGTIEIRKLNNVSIPADPIGDFDPEIGRTIEFGLTAKSTRLVQVLETEVRTYDTDFGLSQIVPVEDESGEELKVRSASIFESYTLLIRDDGSALFLISDSSGDLDEIPVAMLKNRKWVSGCFNRSSFTQDRTICCLLDDAGSLTMLDMASPGDPIYGVDGLSETPTVFPSSKVEDISGAEELCEVQMSNIGFGTLSFPYLILRNTNDDIFVYAPFQSKSTTPSCQLTLSASISWKKVLTHFSLPLNESESEPAIESHSRLKPVHNLSGYNTVFLTGRNPLILIREVSSALRAIPLDIDYIAAVCGVRNASISSEFVFLDGSGDIRFGSLPQGRYGDIGWHVRTTAMDVQTNNIRYHAPQDAIVVGSEYKRPFKLPPDEYHPEWEEEVTTFLPQTEQGMVRLFDAPSMTEIDRFLLLQNEIITCLEVVNIVVSEFTFQRKMIVAVGTAVMMGEDLAQNGNLYLFDVVDAVPIAGKANTNRRLKLILQENVKGAVSAVSEIGTQGLLLVAHGQKCMVRGLKEDGTFLPTAFLDLQCYVPSIKTISGTGMAVMGDALKGLWFVGYTEDPYKLILFGKSQSLLEVTHTEFFPYGDQLFMMAVDADGYLRLFEFAPEDPKSVSGQRLLERCSFFLGTAPTRLLRLSPPSHIDPAEPQHQILASTEFGGVSLISSVPSEASYRNLHALQNYLATNLEHPCSLNPRAFRQVETDGFGSRGILDGCLLSKWQQLTSTRRTESSGRVGAKSLDLRRDLSIVLNSLDRLGPL